MTRRDVPTSSASGWRSPSKEWPLLVQGAFTASNAWSEPTWHATWHALPYEIPVSPVVVERSAQSDDMLAFGLALIALGIINLVVTLVLAWRARR